MARHLISGKETINKALKGPNEEIKAYLDYKQGIKEGKSIGEDTPPPKPTTRRLNDGDCLYLAICVNGVTHCWRFDYSFRGIRQTLSLGVYDRVGLSAARDKADEARKMLGKGIDPGAARKAAKAAIKDELSIRELVASGKPLPNSFEEIARRWSSTKHNEDCSVGHVERTLIRLEQFIFPYLGNRAIDTIEAPEILACIRRIEARGTIETAQRTNSACGQVFDFAIAEGKCRLNPAAALKNALMSVRKGKHAAITDPKQLRGLLLAIQGYRGAETTRAALRLSPLIFQRPGELRQMEWDQLDLDNAMWTVPGSLMKRSKEGKEKGGPHYVPLSTQAVEILRDLQPLTGPGRYVFPAVRSSSRPMSENTVVAALQAMGYGSDVMTAQGFRATARTLLMQELDVPPAIIEAQLAHIVMDANGDSYNRATWMERRHEMMQDWADYLDRIRSGKESERRPKLSANGGQIDMTGGQISFTPAPAHQRA